MPTLRPRHMITETDELTVALDAAALVWPHAKSERTELLRLIIKRGVDLVEKDALQIQARKHRAIEQLASEFGDTWPDNWQIERDQEWPA